MTYNLKRADIVHGCMSLTDLEWERESIRLCALLTMLQLVNWREYFDNDDVRITGLCWLTGRLGNQVQN